MALGFGPGKHHLRAAYDARLRYWSGRGEVDGAVSYVAKSAAAACQFSPNTLEILGNSVSPSKLSRPRFGGAGERSTRHVE